MTNPIQVTILLFDGCDLLDAGGPYEVFLTASRLAARDGDAEPFRVDAVTLDDEPVKAYGGLGLTPTASAASLDDADVVIVPGTIDLDTALANTPLLDAVARLAGRDGGVTASVCTGAFFLGETGALEGRPWTTHWEDIELLAGRIGSAAARRGVRWVDDGDVVTSGGLSSGIAMALHLVERFAGRDLAERTATQLDYEWSNRSHTAN
ncbi:MAG: DJ-1/PfpI family protein [Actinomycetota bacterium]